MRRHVRMTVRWLRWLLNLYPPYLWSGVRVRALSADFRYIRVELGLHFYNRNYVGTHFGGSLFSMTDPFYMLMLLHNLGPAYIVWDRSATITFRKASKARVSAVFRLDEAVLDELRVAASSGEPVLRTWKVEVREADGDVVAEVEKTLYVRLKPEHRPVEGA